MDLGQCPRCSTPYTASELSGFGILRAREARSGGPRMDYTCQVCGRLIRLVPHGEGRYALPGEPPPPAVPEEERRPPWVGSEPPPAGGEPEPGPAWEVEEPEGEEVATEAPAPPGADETMGAAEAMALLGVSAAAEREDIERAFRERSRTCHPDKVAHLDPEFQELAERKFKQLRRAYDLLVG